MIRFHNILIFFTFFILSFMMTANAQSSDDAYHKAENAYEYGHFEVVDSLLKDHVGRLNPDDKIGAYRLLALSALNQDQPQQAEAYVAQLLAIDPFYTAYNDSPRFADILERLKKGKTTITTASQQEETLEEVPVPVTLITEAMIRASGARTLSELLLQFVPGMTRVAGTGDNVAMRGVYGMTQETILVLEDGHRLNSQSTNAMPMDYRINLDKIKQVEVLRGPASSLYGNVALTAVVNIITKSGSDLDGCLVTASAGKNKSFGASFINGHGNLRTDYLAWVSVYNSQGEKVDDGKYTRYIDGFNGMPTFDLGMKIRWQDFALYAVAKHAKPVPYYNIIDAGGYNYDKYGKQYGEKPGNSSTNLRFDLSYNHKWNDFSLSVSAFACMEREQLYNVVGDAVDPELAKLLLLSSGIKITDSTKVNTAGLWENIDLKDYTFGGSVSGAYKYSLPMFGMGGSVLFGLQYEYFMRSYGNFLLGSNFDKTHTIANNMFHEGDEQTASGFVQIKHNFTKRLILNGGIRSDHRVRYDGSRKNTIAPRLSIIWLANDVFNIKGGFAHSFVDAPYFYRSSLIPVFSGEGLDPEALDAANLSASFDWKPLHLKCEVTAHFTSVKDLVFYDLNSSTQSTFCNSGKVDMLGIENHIQYSTTKTLINCNLTYQYPIKIQDYIGSKSHTATNVPRFTSNITAAQELFNSRRFGRFWLRGNVHVQSAIDLYILRLEEVVMNALFEAVGMEYSLSEPERQSTKAIAGLGAEWSTPVRGLTASFDTYNLFNTKYKIGGLCREGIPQQGFSFVGKLRFQF